MTTDILPASRISSQEIPRPISENHAGQVTVLAGKCFRVELNKSSNEYSLETSSTNKLLSFLIKFWHSVQRAFEWDTRLKYSPKCRGTSLQAVQKTYEISTITKASIKEEYLVSKACPITGKNLSKEQAIICTYEAAGDTPEKTTILVSREGINQLLLKPFFEESEFRDKLNQNNSDITRELLLSANFSAVTAKSYSQCSNTSLPILPQSTLSASTKVSSPPEVIQTKDKSQALDTKKPKSNVTQNPLPAAKEQATSTVDVTPAAAPSVNAAPELVPNSPDNNSKAEKTDKDDEVSVKDAYESFDMSSKAIRGLDATLQGVATVQNKNLLSNRHYYPSRNFRCPITKIPLCTSSAIKLCLIDRSLLISREGAIQALFESHCYPDKFKSYPFTKEEIQRASFKRVS
ncbi:hypothetical protein JQC92_12965 [Shewanella sp. 202IG2-18]|uniref:hypothetical protein n=1 Tax=Parashewanella hymeniacidonis TaxID=2807618 RepID=UPI001961E116|nr:hypothetical protein [Parashewanella hymeniacidonis]MBM7072932.1 hypothetical protein [Parashewanella hymeniacidonis]